MTLHGKLFIGSTLATGNGDTTRPTSPLDNRLLEPGFHQAAETDVDAAMSLAEEAFTAYRRTSGEQRAGFLEAMSNEIMELGDALIDRGHLETGLPKPRLVGERGRTCGQLKMFADLVRDGSWTDARIDTALPDREPLPKPDLRRMLSPLGPVVVFGASNFPLAFSVAGGDTASALAVGCPVVVKAHSAHPGTAELVATAIGKAVAGCGMPPGVFSMLHGRGSVVGIALVKHPLTCAAGFTGSREGGRALFDAAVARPVPIPVFAEMSSLNPVFLLPEALQRRSEAIAEGLTESFTLGVGQFCTKPGLVFGVSGDALTRFQEQLCARVTAAAPATMLHAGICATFHEGLSHARQVSGASVLAESSQAADPGQTHGEPVVMQTDAETFLSQPQLAKEVFGPFTLVVAGQSIEELEKVAAGLEGQLTATLHGTEADLAEAGGLVRILERKAGRLIVNGFPTGVEVCPSMNHGGPYPATTDARFTSVGTAAIQRWARPICYQDFPAELLPAELQDSNPRGVRQLRDGVVS
ncbi:MAG: aldehyde dehydrogenase (NADP(+)) [Verrucomicrobia bacterium]|nr:aldehyde dehydrogenase (NADP(+)) [Verrucomicrobiota bacterium]MDA1086973.1 aldehyde dehydrogenase (NADP(+)) [Verrucomicrobiota bacterium]